MIIRKAEEGKEHRYSEEEGEVICCPICGTIVFQDKEGDGTHNACSHLRFHWDDMSREFNFYDDWDMDSFVEIVEKLQRQFGDDEDEIEANFEDIIDMIQHPEIDEVIEHSWNEDPIVQLKVLWGYKR
jgi:hypothetical protein